MEGVCVHLHHPTILALFIFLGISPFPYGVSASLWHCYVGEESYSVYLNRGAQLSAWIRCFCDRHCSSFAQLVGQSIPPRLAQPGKGEGTAHPSHGHQFRRSGESSLLK